MEVTNLFAAAETDDVAQPPGVHALRPVFRLPDHFIDEVAEMQHEAELIVRRPLLVLPDHPAVGRRGAMLHVRTADEGEAHGPATLGGRRSYRAAHSAAEATLVGKAVPVNARGFKSRRQHTAGPVRLGGSLRPGVCHSTPEGRIIGDLDRQLPRYTV